MLMRVGAVAPASKKTAISATSPVRPPNLRCCWSALPATYGASAGSRMAAASSILIG